MNATPNRKSRTASRKKAHKGEKAEPVAMPEAVVAPVRTGWKLAGGWLKRIVLVLLFLALIPVILTPLYRIEAIRPVSTLMLARAVTCQPVERNWVELEDVAPVLWHSVIMSEDGQFCRHHGIDRAALRAEIGNALDGEGSRGASTITMQLAKNLFLWGGRSYLRKALELPLAVWIDLVLPKHRIMEIYLNIAEWGPEGEFGIEAGANRRFSVSAGSLSRRQAALMAASLPNPVTRNPAQPDSAMRRVADVIERRARRSGAYVDCIADPLAAARG